MTYVSEGITIDTANPVLQSIAASTRGAILQRAEVAHFDLDTVMLKDGQPGGLVLFPLNGSFQMCKATSRGRRQIICNGDATSCGGMCMFAFGDSTLAEARGLGAGQVLVLPRSEFEELVRTDPVLCRSAWQSAARCMAHLSELIAQLSFNKVGERVVLRLLEDTAQDGDMIRLTQSDLAAEVGTTREVVARCLATLQADGLIRLGRARITVLNREGLRREL